MIRPSTINTSKYGSFFQYFFSDPTSKLPIRDVNNLCKQGIKTEPHLEIGTENFIKECTQNKITNAINERLEYLFLVTKCRNKQLKEFFNKQFVVGYIKIQEVLTRKSVIGKPFFAVRGNNKIVGYENAISVPNLYGRNLNRGDLSKKIPIEQTRELLGYFSQKQDISREWIEEVERVDQEKKTCIGVSNCPMGTLCRRK